MLEPKADRYVVCEKTDGVRYLLLILKGRIWWTESMFTKVKVAFPLPAGEKKSAKDWLHDHTLLDEN